MKIKLSRKAVKFLKNSEKDIRNRVIKKIEGLSIDYFPKGVRRVQEKGKVFRIRVGDKSLLKWKKT